MDVPGMIPSHTWRMALAAELRRLARGHTQAELGALAQVSPSTIGSWLSGARTVSHPQLLHLAEVLDFDVAKALAAAEGRARQAMANETGAAA